VPKVPKAGGQGSQSFFVFSQISATLVAEEVDKILKHISEKIQGKLLIMIIFTG